MTNNNNRMLIWLISLFLALSSGCRTPEARSLLGGRYYADPPGDVAQFRENLDDARRAMRENPDDPDRIIWVGRRLGYLWRMNEAIQVYSAGIERFVEYAPLYRHRGHRYISVRRFGAAIGDLERAAELIEGKPDEIEPDGAPNPQNIPLTTTAFNIWYHLGLARYLNGDFEAALAAWRRCMQFSQRYDDNRCATTYWTWLTLMRLDRRAEAAELLTLISADMRIIENHAYHRLLLLFKGELTPEQVLDPEDATPLDYATSGYGVAMHHWYDGDQDRARELMSETLQKSAYWSAFGFIAAETETSRR